MFLKKRNQVRISLTNDLLLFYYIRKELEDVKFGEQEGTPV